MLLTATGGLRLSGLTKDTKDYLQKLPGYAVGGKPGLNRRRRRPNPCSCSWPGSQRSVFHAVSLMQARSPTRLQAAAGDRHQRRGGLVRGAAGSPDRRPASARLSPAGPPPLT